MARPVVCLYLKPEWREVRDRKRTAKMTDADIYELWQFRRTIAQKMGVQDRQITKMRLDNPYMPEETLAYMYKLRSESAPYNAFHPRNPTVAHLKFQARV